MLEFNFRDGISSFPLKLAIPDQSPFHVLFYWHWVYTWMYIVQSNSGPKALLHNALLLILIQSNQDMPGNPSCGRERGVCRFGSDFPQVNPLGPMKEFMERTQSSQPTFKPVNKPHYIFRGRFFLQWKVEGIAIWTTQVSCMVVHFLPVSDLAKHSQIVDEFWPILHF